jgi:hypothetical protein
MKKKIMANDWAFGELRLAKAYQWAAEMAKREGASFLYKNFRSMMRYHAKECITTIRIAQGGAS